MTIYNMNQKLFFSLFILLIFTCIMYANDSINDIRKEYSIIRESMHSFLKDSIETLEYSADGGIIIYYIDKNNKLRLIECKLYGETGKSFSEYYIKNDSLFFVLKQRYNYNSPYYMTTQKYIDMGFELFDPNKTTLHEHRYYFTKDKLLKWIDDKKNIVSSESSDFLKKEKDILDFFYELVSKFKLKTK